MANFGRLIEVVISELGDCPVRTWQLWASGDDGFGHCLFLVTRDSQIFDALCGNTDGQGYRMARGNMRRYAQSLDCCKEEL